MVAVAEFEGFLVFLQRELRGVVLEHVGGAFLGCEGVVVDVEFAGGFLRRRDGSRWGCVLVELASVGGRARDDVSEPVA